MTDTPIGTVPVAVGPLSELQGITGVTESDQILVRTSDRSVRSTLAGLYPRTTVVGRAAGYTSRTVISR